jgi:hypothetical protein
MTLRDFQQDFNKIAEQIVGQIAEQINSRHAKQVLNSALDLIRPHFLSLGLRVTRLSNSEIEILLPKKSRNLDERGDFLPGILISSATEAYRLLWMRNAPAGEFQLRILAVQYQALKNPKGSVRVRLQLSDLSREANLAELTKRKSSEHEGVLRLHDEDDQICAEIIVKGLLSIQEMLEWK